MVYYEATKKLDQKLSEIFKAAKPNQQLDLKKLVGELAIECSPLGDLAINRRIAKWEAAGKIIILENKVEVL